MPLYKVLAGIGIGLTVFSILMAQGYALIWLVSKRPPHKHFIFWATIIFDIGAAFAIVAMVLK